MKLKETTITVGRTVSLAPYEILRIDVQETYTDVSKEEREKLVERLSKRVLNSVALESRRHKAQIKE